MILTRLAVRPVCLCGSHRDTQMDAAYGIHFDPC